MSTTKRAWLAQAGRLVLWAVVWSAVYALYDARSAHMGLEWLLEALISLVTGRLHYHLWPLFILLGLFLLLSLFRKAPPYAAPNANLTAPAVFLLPRHLEPGKTSLWGKLISLSLGTYLLHPLFLDLTVHFSFPPDSWHMALSIPLRCVIVTTLSLTAAWLIRKLPKVGTLIT